MAAKKSTLLKKPDPKIYRGWTFVLVLSGILTALALAHRAAVNTADYAAPGDGSTGCQVKVRVDGTPVLDAPRSDATILHTLNMSDTALDAKPGLTGAYRELETDDRWVENGRLTIVPGSAC